jgi:hypothetical protein
VRVLKIAVTGALVNHRVLRSPDSGSRTWRSLWRAEHGVPVRAQRDRGGGPADSVGEFGLVMERIINISSIIGEAGNIGQAN